MPRLPEELIPEAETLTEQLREAGLEAPENLRDILIAWEAGLRSEALAATAHPTAPPKRWKLPDERSSVTHKFKFPGAIITPKITCPACDAVAQEESREDLKGYLTMGLYDDLQLGELFLHIDKEGSLLKGIMDALTFVLSVALQHGIPLEVFTRHFRHTKFKPDGWAQSDMEEMRGSHASVLDFLAKYLQLRFPEGLYKPCQK